MWVGWTASKERVTIRLAAEGSVLFPYGTMGSCFFLAKFWLMACFIEGIG